MNKLLLPIFLFCVAALSLISCTSDDVSQLSNVESKEMRFIKLDNLPSWSDFGKNNKKGDAYMEALTRIVDFDGQQVSLRYQSAEEARVSQNLYDDIVELYSKYSSQSHIATRGSLMHGRSDCVACSIANVWAELNPKYSSRKDEIKNDAWNYICYKFGNLGVIYDEDGVNMQSVLSQFFSNIRKAKYPDMSFCYNYDDKQNAPIEACIAIVEISTFEYHCVTVLRPFESGILCRDDQLNQRCFYDKEKIVAVYYVSNPKFPDGK